MLTDIAIKKAQAKKYQYRLKDDLGLYLTISPIKKNKEPPTKTFVYRYRWKGDPETFLKIGRYGTNKHEYTLTKARVKRDEFIDQIMEGVNPKEQPSTIGTFEQSANDWFEFTSANNKWTVKTTRTNRTRLNYAINAFGYKELDKVTSKDVFNLCRQIELSGHVDNAKRVMRVISAVLVWANCHDVTTSMKKSLSKHIQTNHPHILDHEELGLMLRKIGKSNSMIETKLAMNIVIHTFVRQSTWRQAEWSEIKGDMWHVPKEHMKTKKPFLVPLSKQVLAILDQMRAISGDNQYIFSYGHKPNNMMSSGALLRLLERAGYKGRQVPHGFRHIASTSLNEMGFDRDAIEIQLAHIDGGVRGVYNKAESLDLRIPMMQGYSDWLDSLEVL